MLRRSRVATGIDTMRLAQALRTPGIDPRVWCSLAAVTGDPVVDDGGVFVPVTLMPSGLETQARVAAAYAGPGFGLYAPPAVDDEVMVFVPDGEWDHGCVLGPRLWSASDPPPDDAKAHPTDFVLVTGTGTAIRFRAQGDGDVVLTSDGGNTELSAPGVGKAVALGTSSAAQDSIRGTEFKADLDALITAIGVYVAAVGVAVPATAPAAGVFATALSNYVLTVASHTTSKVKVP